MQLTTTALTVPDGERMEYFDIIDYSGHEEDPERLAGLLGYRKIFELGKDALLVDAKDADSLARSGKKLIIRDSSEKGLLIHALKNSAVIGILANSNLDADVMETVKSLRKLIILSASALTSTNKHTRIANLGKMRRVVRDCMHKKLKLAISSFAGQKEYMLSSLQLVEIAKFAGADEETARSMSGALGDFL